MSPCESLRDYSTIVGIHRDFSANFPIAKRRSRTEKFVFRMGFVWFDRCFHCHSSLHRLLVCAGKMGQIHFPIFMATIENLKKKKKFKKKIKKKKPFWGGLKTQNELSLRHFRKSTRPTGRVASTLPFSDLNVELEIPSLEISRNYCGHALQVFFTSSKPFLKLRKRSDLAADGLDPCWCQIIRPKMSNLTDSCF